jgi:hypothetical protein
VDNGPSVIWISLQIRFLLRLIQERKMKKALAILIASVFVAGSALAQAPATTVEGAGGKGGDGGEARAAVLAAGGGPGGVAAAVAAVAILCIIFCSKDNNNNTTPATGTTGGT